MGGEGPTNHMALLVHLDGERWLADAGLGEGFLDPLPFREGAYEIGPFTYTLAREAGGSWWMGQHEWGSVSGFRMTEEESPVSAFEVHHRRLATDPESSFVQTLVVQQPRERPDRRRCARGRSRRSGRRSTTSASWPIATSSPRSCATSSGSRVGGARLERLWAQAVAQHEAFLARA